MSQKKEPRRLAQEFIEAENLHALYSQYVNEELVKRGKKPLPPRAEQTGALRHRLEDLIEDTARLKKMAEAFEAEAAKASEPPDLRAEYKKLTDPKAQADFRAKYAVELGLKK